MALKNRLCLVLVVAGLVVGGLPLLMVQRRNPHTVRRDEVDIGTVTKGEPHHVKSMFEAILRAFRERACFVGTLPPSVQTDTSGRPLASWRFTLVPFLERPPRPVLIDYAWDSEENVYWRQRSNLVYCFDPAGRESKSTGVLAITGSGTGFDIGSRTSMFSLPKSTILIVEARNSRLHWMEPGDIDISNMPSSIGGSEARAICGNTHLGFFVGFADEEVWLLTNEIPFETLKRFFTVDGAESNDRSEFLAEYRVTFDIEP